MKFNKFCVAFLLLMINVIVSHAQDLNPCSDTDPDSTTGCPLDTWVFFLAGAALILGVIRLNKKKASPIGKAAYKCLEK